MTNQEKINVESIKTPEGTIPTVKGLETVVNQLLDSYVAPLTQTITSLNTSLQEIRDKTNQTQIKMQTIGESIAELTILVAKMLEKIENTKSEDTKSEMEDLKAQERNLIFIERQLAELLLKLNISAEGKGDSP